MDKYSVKLMSRALRDLDGIYAYIAETLLEPETALSLVGRIEEQIFSLEYLPYRCPERKRGTYANRGYRQLLAENYMVIYRIDEEKKQVVIVTVRYTVSAKYSCGFSNVSAKYSCGFSNPLVPSIIVGERYLDYFTTITEDRLWQLLAKPVFRWRNRSGLSMNAAKAV